MDDHDFVGDLLDLREHVAGDQDRPPLLGERAKEVAEPPDAGRVEPVRRLVEDQELGSPSSAPASPSRWRIPMEYPPTRRFAASFIATSSSTSSTRSGEISAWFASTRR